MNKSEKIKITDEIIEFYEDNIEIIKFHKDNVRVNWIMDIKTFIILRQVHDKDHIYIWGHPLNDKSSHGSILKIPIKIVDKKCFIFSYEKLDGSIYSIDVDSKNFLKIK